MVLWTDIRLCFISFKLVYFLYDRQLLSVTQVNLHTSCVCSFHCFAGQMYMLSCDGHIDTSDVSVALYPPGQISIATHITELLS